MGIKTVGKQGQPFDSRTEKNIERIKNKYPDLTIAVDGAVNESTIPVLVAAGAIRLAPGSAITRAPDSAEAYKHLHELANSQRGII